MSLLAVAAAVWAAAAAPGGSDSGKAPDAGRPEVAPGLRRVAEGYLANRGGFPSFRCEFRYRVGRARDLEDALAHGPTVNPLTASCRWLIDGANVCYSRVIDAKAQGALEQSKANPKHVVIKGQPGFVAEIPLSARGYLTDGTRALSYDPDFAVNLMGPKRIDELIDGLSPDATPWAMGGLGRTMNSNPGRWLLDGTQGTWRLVGAKQTKDGKRTVVECRRETSRSTYYFDASRGFLPVRRDYRLSDGRSTRIAITEVRKCSGDRWFPARVVDIDMRADGTVWRVQEITLTALDVESKVKPEDMFLVLRPGVRVLHVDNMLSQFRLPGAERVGVRDLEAMHKRCDEAAAQRLRRRAGVGEGP